MSLVVAADYWPPDGGGAEQSVRDMVQARTAAGEPLRVVVPRDRGTHWMRGRTPWWHLGVALRILRAGPVAAIEVGGKAMLPGAWLASRMLGVPVTYTLRDVSLLCPMGVRRRDRGTCRCGPRESLACGRAFVREYHPAAGWLRRVRHGLALVAAWLDLRLCRRPALRRCDRVDAVSQAILDAHRDLIPPGGRVVPTHAALASPTPAATARAWERYGIRTPYILFVGKASAGKGAPVLVEAFRDLARDTDVRLVMAGARPTIPPPGRVRCLGLIPHEDVLALYPGARMVVVPSVGPEARSRVVVEAMTLGCPVIATAVGGTPELIDHARTGLLVPPRDPVALTAAMRRLLDDPALATRLGRAAAEAARGWRLVHGRPHDARMADDHEGW